MYSIKQKGCEIRLDDDYISMFADDVVLLAESESDLQCLIDAVNEWCVNNQMSINVNKTKVMHVPKPKKARFFCV